MLQWPENGQVLRWLMLQWPENGQVLSTVFYFSSVWELKLFPPGEERVWLMVKNFSFIKVYYGLKSLSESGQLASRTLYNKRV
jgi:hypothetical protein